jgi:hypothetical protein
MKVRTAVAGSAVALAMVITPMGVASAAAPGNSGGGGASAGVEFLPLIPLAAKKANPSNGNPPPGQAKQGGIGGGGTDGGGGA